MRMTSKACSLSLRPSPADPSSFRPVKSPSKSVRARGFTIIELLVAISITAAITTLMLTIVINMLSAWNRSNATLTGGNQARLILDQIAVDLQGIVLRRSPDVMLAATIQRDQSGDGDADITAAEWTGTDVKPGGSAAPNGSLHVNPSASESKDIATYRFGQAGVWLRFFTTPPDNSNTNDRAKLSAPRAVAYQIVRRQVGSGSGPFSYQLFRSEVRPYSDSAGQQPYSTFRAGYDLYSSASTATAKAYNDISDANNRGDLAPGGIRSPDANQTIGDGVIDFGVRFYEPDNMNVLKEVFPVDRRAGAKAVRTFAATTDTTKELSTAGAYNAANTSYGYPTVAEVFLRILTPEGVNIIRNYEENAALVGGPSASKWWELAEANSKVYVRRIELPTRAL